MQCPSLLRLNFCYTTDDSPNMDNSDGIRPRAATMPARLLNSRQKGSTRGMKEPARRSSDSNNNHKIHSKDKQTSPPNGLVPPRIQVEHSVTSPRDGPVKIMSPLSTGRRVHAKGENGPRRRVSAITPPNPNALKPPSREGKTRRRSCPAYSSNANQLKPILSKPRTRKQDDVYPPSTHTGSHEGSPLSPGVWDELDERLQNLDIQRDPLPAGSDEFARCMSQLDERNINEKPNRNVKVLIEPPTKPKSVPIPPSPRSQRRVRWLDVENAWD